MHPLFGGLKRADIEAWLSADVGVGKLIHVPLSAGGEGDVDEFTHAHYHPCQSNTPTLVSPRWERIVEVRRSLNIEEVE